MFCAQLTRASLRDPSASKNPDDYVRQHQCSQAAAALVAGDHQPIHFQFRLSLLPCLNTSVVHGVALFPPDIIMKGTQAGMELVLLSKHARRRSIGLDY